MKRLLTTKDLREIYSIPRGTLYHLMKTSSFPRPVKLGRRKVAWIVEDVEKWIEKRKKLSQAEESTTLD